MTLLSHVRPIRSHSWVCGVTVTLKSRFGFWSSASLNTFVSTPAFVRESEGFSHNGPMRTRTVAGSGPPSAVCASTAVEPSTIASAIRKILRNIAKIRRVEHLRSRKEKRRRQV